MGPLRIGRLWLEQFHEHDTCMLGVEVFFSRVFSILVEAEVSDDNSLDSI